MKWKTHRIHYPLMRRILAYKICSLNEKTPRASAPVFAEITARPSKAFPWVLNNPLCRALMIGWPHVGKYHIHRQPPLSAKRAAELFIEKGSERAPAKIALTGSSATQLIIDDGHLLPLRAVSCRQKLLLSCRSLSARCVWVRLSIIMHLRRAGVWLFAHSQRAVLI